MRSHILIKKGFLLFVVSALTGIGLITTPRPAYACTPGTPYPLSEAVEDAPIIVRATVQSVDSLFLNAIIEVNQIYKGGPLARQLLLAQSDPAEYRFKEENPSSGDCYGPGRSLEPGTLAYFFLSHRPDGSYQPVYRSSITVSIYSIIEGNVDARLQFDSDDERQQTVFEENIARLVGSKPQVPVSDAHAPLTAPLAVKTDKGSVYLLPVDGGASQRLPDRWSGWGSSDPQGCTKAGCSTSPVGRSFFATQIESTILVQFSPPNVFSVDGIDDFYWRNPTQSLPGDALLFSPSTLRFLIWRDYRLELYGKGKFGWEKRNILGSAPYRRGITPYDEGFASGVAAWSPDEQYVAYSDYNGLWLWDVTTPDTLPRLLVPMPDPVKYIGAMFFSPLSHYLAVSYGDTRFNLDIMTGARLPYGVFSPDERYLLTGRDLADHRPELCASSAALDGRCGTQALPIRFRNPSLAWRSTSEFAYLSCESAEPAKCEAFEGNIDGVLRNVPARRIAVEPKSGAVAIQTEDSEISFRQDGMEWVFRGSGMDGAIVDIRWMPSLLNAPERDFYYQPAVNIRRVVWNSDSTLVASADNQGGLFLLSPPASPYDSATLVKTLMKSGRSIDQIAWRPDGAQLATTTLNGPFLRISDATSGVILKTVPGRGDNYEWMSWISANALFLSQYGPDQNVPRIFDPVSGVQADRPAFKDKSPVLFVPDNPRLVLFDASTASKTGFDVLLLDSSATEVETVAHIDFSKVERIHTQFNTITCFRLSASRTRIAFGTVDGHIGVWEVPANKLVLYKEASDAESSTEYGLPSRTTVLDVRFSADEKRVMSISTNSALRIIEIDHPETYLTSLHLAGVPLDAAQFSPDGKWLALAARSPVTSIFSITVIGSR